MAKNRVHSRAWMMHHASALAHAPIVWRNDGSKLQMMTDLTALVTQQVRVLYEYMTMQQVGCMCGFILVLVV